MPDQRTVDGSKLQLLCSIGAGGFAQVYKAEHQCWGTVAVKRLKNSNVPARLEAEGKRLQDISHQNIIQFYGMVVGQGHVDLILEYMEKGSLQKVNRHNPTPLLKEHFIEGTVLGLNYLHTLDPPIIHMDIKIQNILLTDSLDVKITDFGLSECRSELLDEHPSQRQGTMSHVPPECLYNPQKATELTYDLYSLAILIWEILTGKHPYKGLRQEQVAAGVVDGLRPDVREIPDSTQKYVIDIMKLCWNENPTNRLTCQEIRDRMKIQHMRMQDYEKRLGAEKLNLHQKYNEELSDGSSLGSSMLATCESTSLSHRVVANGSRNVRIPTDRLYQQPQNNNYTNDNVQQTIQTSDIHFSDVRDPPQSKVEPDGVPSDTPPSYETGPWTGVRHKLDSHGHPVYNLPSYHDDRPPDYNTVHGLPANGHHQTNGNQLPSRFNSVMNSLTDELAKTGLPSGSHVGHTTNHVMVGNGNVMNVDNSGAMMVPRKPIGKTSVPKIVIKMIHIDICCEHVGNNWRDLGRKLEFSNGQLDIIQADYIGMREQIHQMITKWKEMKSTKATLPVLVQALYDSGCREAISRLKKSVMKDT